MTGMDAVRTVLLFAGTAGACYLIGSIPCGYLLAGLRGIDIREAGSRNIGATNVSRVLGRRMGAVVLVLDMLKGAVPTWSVGRWLAGATGGHDGMFHALWVSAALACVLGHVFPVYLRFRGGKGVATGFGATLGIYPIMILPCLCAAALWITVLLATRTVSLASLSAAASFPLSTPAALWPVEPARDWPILLYALLIPMLVTWRHRENLQRLRAGTEPRVGRPRN